MKQTDIQLRLYKSILIAGICLSVMSIIGNHISSFPFLASLKWIGLLFITVIAFLFSDQKKYSSHIMFGVFLFLVCIFLPFAFVDSGGSNNNAIGYTFLLLISVTYLFSEWKRRLLICLLIGTFIAMHAFEYFYPELIPVYTGWSQFLDRMIQIPLQLLASFLIILQFAKEYEKVNRKLDKFANSDELTGLYNRRMFNKAIEEAANKNNEQIHLALIDLDNFKKINDQYGHHIGDEVLKKLSTLLAKTFEIDKHIVSRWGGDEFAIIYYGASNELFEKLETIRKAFKEYVSVYELTTGISTSIVSLNDYDEVTQTLIAVDHQLYKVKQNKSRHGSGDLLGEQG